MAFEKSADGLDPVKHRDGQALSVAELAEVPESFGQTAEPLVQRD
jgi:hypothetical protein